MKINTKPAVMRTHEGALARRISPINVSSNQNGVGYGDWIHIDGFSESVVSYISEIELGRPFGE